MIRLDYHTTESLTSDMMERNCAMICEHGIEALTTGRGYDLQVRGIGRWAVSLVSSDQDAVMVAVIKTLKTIEEQMAPPPVRQPRDFPVCFFRKVDTLPQGTIYSTVPFSAVFRRVKEYLQKPHSAFNWFFNPMKEGADQCTRVYDSLDFKLKAGQAVHEGTIHAVQEMTNLNFFVRECRMAVASKHPLDKEQVVRSVVAQVQQELNSNALKIDPYGMCMPNIQDVLNGAWASRHAKDTDSPHH